MATYFTKTKNFSDAVQDNSCDDLDFELAAIAAGFVLVDTDMTATEAATATNAADIATNAADITSLETQVGTNLLYGIIPLPFNADFTTTPMTVTTRQVSSIDAQTLSLPTAQYVNAARRAHHWVVHWPYDARSNQSPNFEFLWEGVATAGGNIRWYTTLQTYDIGDVIPNASGASTNVILDIAPVTAYRSYKATIPINLGAGHPLSPGKILVLTLDRNPADAGDTYAQDANVLSAWLKYERNV